MKKVLIITYYWPPAGGVAVQRVVKFCKYLQNYGWQPIVLTVKNGNFEYLDLSYNKDINIKTKVYQAKSFEPHFIFNLFKNNKKSTGKPKKNKNNWVNTIGNFVRLNFFIPDSRIGWYFSAYKLGLKIIEDEKPDLIFSTAPPYTVHLIAHSLKKKTNTPWVADFRDPWLENVIYDKPYRLLFSRWINAYLERKIINSSDKIITVSPQLKKLLENKKHIKNQSHFKIIPNGYDKITLLTKSFTPKRFYLSYFGTMYFDRCPDALFDAIEELLNENKQIKEKLRFRFYGNMDIKSQEKIDKSIPHENQIINTSKPYDSIKHLFFQSQVFILTIPEVCNNNLIVTGKIFDYLPTGNPILGIGPVEGDAGKIIRETMTGIVLDYSDKNNIKEKIIEYFTKWQNNTLNSGILEFEKYQREFLAQKLSEEFNTLLK